VKFWIIQDSIDNWSAFPMTACTVSHGCLYYGEEAIKFKRIFTGSEANALGVASDGKPL